MRGDLLYRQQFGIPSEDELVTSSDNEKIGDRREGWRLVGTTYPVQITTESRIVIPQNQMRGYLLLVNRGGVDIDVSVGGPNQIGTGIPIVAGSFYELGPDCAMTFDFKTGKVRPAGVITNEIWAIAPAGNVVLSCTHCVWTL